MGWQAEIGQKYYVEYSTRNGRMEPVLAGVINPQGALQRKEGKARTIVTTAVPLGLVLALAPAALAQQAPPLPNPLEQLPNQNAAQRDMATSITNMCPTLDATLSQRRNQGPPPSPNEEDLLESCSKLWVTADVALGRQPQNPDFNLGLNTEQTNNALQSVNGEEMQSTQQQFGNIQASNISGRLAAIRTGAAGRGFSIAGLRFASDRSLASVYDYSGYSSQGSLVASVAASEVPMTLAQGEESEPWFGPWGVFLTGSVAFGDKDATGSVDGFDFVLPGVTAGVDYKVSDNLVVGGAFGFAHFDVDFDSTPRSPSGQSLDSNSYSLSVFGSYFIGEKFFVEGIGTIGYTGYDSTRRIVIPSENPQLAPLNRSADGDFDALQYSIAANVGYQYTISGVDLLPIARIHYLAADIDGFTETGGEGLNLKYDDYDVDSLTTRVGLQASYAIDMPIGVVVPYVRGEYVYEFLNDNDGPLVRYAADPTGLSAFVITTEDPDRNYGDLGAGVALTLPHGWVTFLDYAAIVGFSNFAIHSVAAGFRKDF